ncbi:peptide ABC transporter ATP-binding protein [Catellatospora sp. TT07R-123]|uniref:ABC transporter ATP-binding protein n=1 Tax=Catellatospora sp. TT07R-123 TaxID=2733863 RepID=UPI001B12913C|nr:ABC transporter ATP-binding protein [Catellatospora sp. TT07R-123]GHJ43097.1 peptide ABC transporter ATP-binding protein [Catellatospora sp. TT07R-123]
MSVVAVRDLTVRYGRRGLLHRGHHTAVDAVSFSIAAGRTLGLAGESGSGKSSVARALMRVHDPAAGSVRVAGREVTTLRGAALRRFRRHMQMVFQDPYDSLNPRLTAGDNVAEALTAAGVPRPDQITRTRELFDRVGLPAAFTGRYPHQLSGGQRQRVSIARALAVAPQVLVCDEAVSALDVSVRAQILNLLKDLQEADGLAYLFISHDMSTLRFIADDVAIMYQGRIVELGTSADVFAHPRHPYTQALLAAIPQPGAGRRHRRGIVAGEAPAGSATVRGCAFAPRCPLATDVCRSRRPELLAGPTGHQTACHHADTAPAAAPSGDQNPQGRTAA